LYWIEFQLMSNLTQPACDAATASRYRVRSLALRVWRLPPAENPNRLPVGAGAGAGVAVVVVVGVVVVVVVAVVVVVGVGVVVVVVGGGAAGSATTAVCFDVAVADPFLFVATTVTRIVLPTSAPATR
jgi:hypothetical protein